MTMKYLLKTALCLLLCALLSLPALAKEGEELTCGDYIYVLLEDGGARITGYYGEDAELTIPAELDGHAVREIGEEAFRDCDLTTVTLPEGLTSIGDSAFYSCNSLTAVTLPEGLTSIGTNPFSSCDSLAKIDVSPDHPVFARIDGVLYEKATKTLICYPAGKAGDSFAVPDGILAIGDGAFSDCSSLTTITLPDGLTSIGNGAFSGCSSLTSVTLPEGLTSIGERAFQWCESLTTITLPDGLTSIGDDAFSFCFSLTTVTLPKGLTSIGTNPFISCDSLEKIDVSPDHPVFEQIDGVLYEKATKTLISYPAGKEGDSFAVPDGILTIGDRAFSGCSSLTTVTLPEGLTSIGDSAFSNCSSLTSVTLPDSLTSIGVGAFEDCPETLTLTVSRDSYACQYAIDNGLVYTYPDANDWLYA